MLACLVLGMGIPTIPNYIITSSLAAPALLARRAAHRLAHVRLLLRHHGGLDAAGGACGLRRSPIAQASGLRIGLQAMRIAIAGFVIPYMAVYARRSCCRAAAGSTPLHRGQGDLAIGLWGAASIGFLGTHMTWPERIAAAAAAGCWWWRCRLPTRWGSRSGSHWCSTTACASGARRRRRPRDGGVPRAGRGRAGLLPVTAFTLAWTHSVERCAGKRIGASRARCWSRRRRGSTARPRAWSRRPARVLPMACGTTVPRCRRCRSCA